MTAWFVVALVAAVVIGKSVQLADRRSPAIGGGVILAPASRAPMR